MEKNPQTQVVAQQHAPESTAHDGLSMLGPEGESAAMLQMAADDSPQVRQLRSMQWGANQSMQVRQLRRIQDAANAVTMQRKEGQPPAAENKTGLPDKLKSGIEGLGGHALDDVRVHYNSDKPAQMQAHAYAQGSDIHVAPGQERHLPHEAWHVVQQKQGRVKPTLQLKGVAINDDSALEKEADAMGAKAMSGGGGASSSPKTTAPVSNGPTQRAVVQRIIHANVEKKEGSEMIQKSFAQLETKGWGKIQKLVAEYLADDPQALFESTEMTGPGAENYSKAILSQINAEAVEVKDLGPMIISEVYNGDLWHDDKPVYAEVKALFKDMFEAKKLAVPIEEKTKITELWGKDEQLGADVLEGYGVNITKILEKAYVTPLKSVKKVGDFKDFGLEALNSSVGFKIYEQIAAKKKAQPAANAAQQVAAAPATKPFLRLIDDINAGVITKLAFADKYDSKGSGLGAEFTVETPVAKAQEYKGAAVVHTHYDSKNDVPNYGHTKPEALKKSSGFGFTKVKLERLLAIDHTRKAWKDLSVE